MSLHSKKYARALYTFIIVMQFFVLDAKDVEIMPFQQKKEFEIPPTEDLMREHGILSRILLIYEEIIRRIDTQEEFPLSTLINAIDIIQSFIENYHERLEENYIFPLFEAKKVEVRLVRTLKNQHNKGRAITSRLRELSTAKDLKNPKTKKEIKNLLIQFIRMYRPHEAREDTFLFPKVRSLIPKKEFKELGEKFEELEHKLFGENGFKSIVKKVEDIEKILGIYKLEQFTANPNQ